MLAVDQWHAFFFNDTATTEIYTLSLHDALPILQASPGPTGERVFADDQDAGLPGGDRKSTRLNSSHSQISYAVFCLKKKINRFDPGQGGGMLQKHLGNYVRLRPLAACGPSRAG